MAAPPEPRLTTLSIGLTGLAMALLEVLSFRLDSAVFGAPFARIVAAVVPAFAGAVAAWAASRARPARRDDRPASSAVLAAYAAGAAGMGCAVTAVALIWTSQEFGK